MGRIKMNTVPSADGIEQIAFGFMASKVLFSAIEFGLFTELAKGPMNADQIQKRCGLHSRSIRDFLDVLVALGMLNRQGELYRNTGDADF
jgi:predicted transcriptional regulator